MTFTKPSAAMCDASADGREVELKLGLSAAAAAKLRRLPLIRERAAGPPETARLETIYFDTPTLDLFHAGVFLRVRRKGDRFVQALKTRGTVLSGIEDRRETEIDLPDDKVRPDLVVDPPTVLRRKKVRKRLEPLVTTDISRTAWLLDDAHGGRIELALDTGRIEAGSRVEPISEIELELVRGEPGSLFDLSLDLLDGVALRSGDASKAVRGFDLLEPSVPEPVRSTEVRLGPTQSVDEAFQAIARSCLAQILANEPAAANGIDPEGVHQMRVGVRRLRSAMALFSKILVGDEGEAIASELKWLLDRLGPARDMDVFLSDILRPLVAYFANSEAVVALDALAEQRRVREYRSVRAMLKTPRYTRLLLRLGRWIEQRGWSENAGKKARRLRAACIASHAAAVLAKRHARLRDAGRDIENLPAPDLHRIRIHVKKQRYAVEFFSGLFDGRRSVRYLGALKTLQNSLGYLNDAAVAERLVDELISGQPRAAAKTGNARIGGAMLAGWHGCEVASHRESLFESWHRFDEHKKFWK